MSDKFSDYPEYEFDDSYDSLIPEKEHISNWKYWAAILIDEQKIIRYAVYKRMFTPYEQQQAFSDESQFTSYKYNFGILTDAFELPDGDLLLKIHELNVEACDDECYGTGHYDYYKLSQIEISEFDCDERLILSCD